MAVVVLVYEVVLLSVRLAATDFDGNAHLLYPVVASMVLWPLLSIVLRIVKRRAW